VDADDVWDKLGNAYAAIEGVAGALGGAAIGAILGLGVAEAASFNHVLCVVVGALIGAIGLTTLAWFAGREDERNAPGRP
jgi:hypothetical protein